MLNAPKHNVSRFEQRAPAAVGKANRMMTMMMTMMIRTAFYIVSRQRISAALL